MMLDTVERLMATEGYASVSYRAVAAGVGVTAGLVQYYFPTLDELFEAAVRRRADENLERLVAALAARPDEPLHVLWEASQDEASSVLMTEFLALGNHRKTIRAVIAEVSERARQVQLAALKAAGTGRARRIPPEDLAFLVNGIPKIEALEVGAGLATTGSIRKTCLRFLDELEPPKRRAPRSRPAKG